MAGKNTSANLPSISIITPSFNQGRFLEECIDSVLSQNYPNLEFIIMDGGSSDGSVEIIKKYEKYLTYWQSQPDGGQYAAIQAGFERSSGEIMAWLNSDDKYHANAFFLTAYVFSCNPEIEWLTGKHTLWDKDGQIIGLYPTLHKYSREQLMKMRRDVAWIQQESTFWRRLLWESAGGYIRPDLNYAGDYDLWVRFSRYAAVYSVNALLGGYRIHDGQKAQAVDRYLEEVEAVYLKELSVAASEGIRATSNTVPPVEIDYPALRIFYHEVLPAGQRPNFSSHQTFVYLQKERKSLDILVSRFRVKFEQLSKGNISVKQFTKSLFMRLTTPLRKLLNLLGIL
jgi:glycosyltransferase involved in cell wall biosynthesis